MINDPKQPPLPNERVQINVRLDAATRQTFQAECRKIGREQNEIMEMLIETWLAHGSDRGHYHLDGNQCPMAALMQGIEAIIRDSFTRRGP